MIKEFEGRTEEEAIKIAIKKLGLNREDVDIEIIENKKGRFFFGKNKVKIRVHLEEDDINEEINSSPENDFEKKIITFVNEVIKKMELKGKTVILSREEKKLYLEIKSDYSGILIGKKGKTLDALQLLVNVMSNKINDNNKKIILDTEDYRRRREQSLMNFANKIAEQVKRSRTSILLEAMNPFERRLVHTTLNKYIDLETISEGDGLYKKIRVLYKGKQTSY